MRFHSTPKRLIRRCYITAGLVTLALSLGVVNAAADDHTGNLHRDTQVRPIELGTSGSSIEFLEDNDGNQYCYTGTLGGLVEANDGTQSILSNSHVLAQIFTGNTAVPSGTPVIQAGLLEHFLDPDPSDPSCIGDYSGDTVATLSAYIPIIFDCGFRGPFIRCGAANTVDAAIAEVVGGTVAVDGSVLEIGPLAIPTLPPAIGMNVQKSGRTTAHTRGSIAAIDVEVAVCYGVTQEECQDPSNIALFSNQARVDDGAENFSAGGDSGSVIVECSDGDGDGDCDPLPRAVGLLFAGGGSSTFFNPIDAVLASFDVGMAGCAPDCVAGGGGDDGGGDDGDDGGPPPGRGGGRPFLAGDQAVGLEIARDVRAQNAERLFQIPGAVGSGVGVDENGNPVIEVYLTNAQARVDDPIPTDLDGVPVRAIVTGVIQAY